MKPVVHFFHKKWAVLSVVMVMGFSLLPTMASAHNNYPAGYYGNRPVAVHVDRNVYRFPPGRGHAYGNKHKYPAYSCNNSSHWRGPHYHGNRQVVYYPGYPGYYNNNNGVLSNVVGAVLGNNYPRW